MLNMETFKNIMPLNVYDIHNDNIKYKFLDISKNNHKNQFQQNLILIPKKVKNLP